MAEHLGMAEHGPATAGAPVLRIDHDPVPVGTLEFLDRVAVRAVIGRDDRLLMVRSGDAGDVKFPGGGVEPGETDAHALVREVSEECGRVVTGIGGVALVALEHRVAREPGAMFRMTSRYYRCQVADQQHALRLDPYERDLGLRPVWITVAEAIVVNREVVAGGSAQTWVERETRVLEHLRDLGLGGLAGAVGPRG